MYEYNEAETPCDRIRVVLFYSINSSDAGRERTTGVSRLAASPCRQWGQMRPGLQMPLLQYRSFVLQRMNAVDESILCLPLLAVAGSRRPQDLKLRNAVRADMVRHETLVAVVVLSGRGGTLPVRVQVWTPVLRSHRPAAVRVLYERFVMLTSPQGSQAWGPLRVSYLRQHKAQDCRGGRSVVVCLSRSVPLPCQGHQIGLSRDLAQGEREHWKRQVLGVVQGADKDKQKNTKRFLSDYCAIPELFWAFI